MCRVVRKEGRLILLTSTRNMQILSQAFTKCPSECGVDQVCSTFSVIASHPVALGVLPACIVVLKRKCEVTLRICWGSVLNSLTIGNKQVSMNPGMQQTQNAPFFLLPQLQTVDASVVLRTESTLDYASGL